MPQNHKSLDVPTMAFPRNRNPLDLPLSFYLVSTFKREQKGRRSMIAQQKETGCDGYCDECGSIDYSVVECRLTFNP